MPSPTPALTAHQVLETQQSAFQLLPLESCLEDLCARFIVNLPAEELESMDRVCFQIEQAHWYYEDFVRPSSLHPSSLPSFQLKHFSLLMFKICPLLHHLIATHPQIWSSFMSYKERVPVCGAILINQSWDKVLLVKGWTKSASWSFPRGKINKDESPAQCALREVLEETGYDLTPRFQLVQLENGFVEREGDERNPYFVEVVIKEQKIRLYFIQDVDEGFSFETRTRKEISKIEWYKLGDLPTWGKDRDNKKKGKVPVTNKNLEKGIKFYMVTPFISHLKLWIDRNKPKNLPPSTSRRPPSINSNGHPAHPSSFLAPSARELPPHLLLQREAANGGEREAYLPPGVESDADYYRSTSPSSSGRGDENEVTSEERDEPRGFETTEEGTRALKAFFFGSEELSLLDINDDKPPLPLPIPTSTSTSSPSSSNRTPPQIAYERQQSFVQPKPKFTPHQTNKLLALLTDKNPTVSPRPPTTEYNQTTSSILDSLLGHDRAPSTSSTAELSPETETTESDRKKEKHLSLLRALHHVASNPPPPIESPAVPDSIRNLFRLEAKAKEGGVRSGLGEEQGEEGGEVEVDEDGWPTVGVERKGDGEGVGEGEGVRTRRVWSPSQGIEALIANAPPFSEEAIGGGGGGERTGNASRSRSGSESEEKAKAKARRGTGTGTEGGAGGGEGREKRKGDLLDILNGGVGGAGGSGGGARAGDGTDGQRSRSPRNTHWSTGGLPPPLPPLPMGYPSTGGGGGGGQMMMIQQQQGHPPPISSSSAMYSPPPQFGISSSNQFYHPQQQQQQLHIPPPLQHQQQQHHYPQQYQYQPQQQLPPHYTGLPPQPQPHFQTQQNLPQPHFQNQQNPPPHHNANFAPPVMMNQPYPFPQHHQQQQPLAPRPFPAAQGQGMEVRYLPPPTMPTTNTMSMSNNYPPPDYPSYSTHNMQIQQPQPQHPVFFGEGMGMGMGAHTSGLLGIFKGEKEV